MNRGRVGWVDLLLSFHQNTDSLSSTRPRLVKISGLNYNLDCPAFVACRSLCGYAQADYYGGEGSSDKFCQIEVTP